MQKHDNPQVRNAWRVDFRFPKRKDESREWMHDMTFPAVDVIEYDGQPYHAHRAGSFDIGQGRAYVHANWLKERFGSEVETRVTFVGVKPWWLKEGEPPTREFPLIAKYDSVIKGE